MSFSTSSEVMLSTSVPVASLVDRVLRYASSACWNFVLSLAKLSAFVSSLPLYSVSIVLLLLGKSDRKRYLFNEA